MKNIAIIFFSLLCSTIAAQQHNSRVAIENALIQYKDLDTDPQLLLLERSLQKAEKMFSVSDTTTAKVYKALSDWYRDNSDFDLALSFSKKHLASLIDIADYPIRTAEAYTLTAERLLELYNFEKAGEYFQKSLDLNQSTVKSYDFRNYKGLATVLLSQGNFNLQIQHAKYAYDLAETPAEKCHALHSQFQGYARLGDIDACYKNIEEQLAISKRNKLDYCRGRAYSSLGWVHNLKARPHYNAYKRELTKAYASKSSKTTVGESERAIELKKLFEPDIKASIGYYDKGVSFLKGSGHRDEMRAISWAYKNISNQYKGLGKLDLSIQYAKLAIQENRAFFGKEYYPELADLFHNLSTKYSLPKKYGGPEDYESALRQIQNAIKCLLQDETFSDTREVIPQDKLYKVSIKWQLLTELKEKALCYAHLYINHGNREDLESAERHLSNAVELIDIMRAEFSTDDTKIFWRNRTRFIYDTAVEMGDWLADNDKVLKYMEKSRALLLLDELNNKDAKTFIPEKLAQREKDLRDAFVDADESDILQYKIYNTYLDSLKEAYPSYYKYKFDVRTPSLVEVQSEILDDSTQVLSYHITNDSLYMLNVTKKSSSLSTQANPRMLKPKVQRLLSLLNNKDSLEFQKNYEEFIGLSKELKTILLSGMNPTIPKVIIVGDGIINYVPFDVLSKENADGSPRFMIEDYTFSFAPSLSVLLKYTEAKEFNQLLMISPRSFLDQNLIPLAQSDEEIEEIKNITNTAILESGAATLTNFIEVCKEYDVIHFSTHSGIREDTNEPWIAFQDSLISLNEIYKLNLDASLVTLSSCKSYDGVDRSGEGINSLSRGFLFADAAAVVGSMWDLNESAGRNILVEFYKGIKNKKDKATALRAAKLQFINDNRYKSPYYWSSLILIGDSDRLSSTPQASGINILYLMSCIGLLLLALFYLNFRTKKP